MATQAGMRTTIRAGGREVTLDEAAWGRLTRAVDDGTVAQLGLDARDTRRVRVDRRTGEIRDAGGAPGDTGDGGPPSWDELAAAFAEVEGVGAELALAKEQLKALLADPAILEAQERKRELAERLDEARGVLHELGRRMQGGAGR